MARVRIVSLFCGCGGMDLGFRGGFTYLGKRYPENPCEIVFSADADTEACALYRQNVGDAICLDLERFDDFPRADVLIGGPPCQPFSAAGNRRGPRDARDLLPVFFKALRIVQPKAFVLENVPGLCEQKRFSAYFEETLRAFRGLGFEVRFRVLDAADFGVPQHRRRLFIIGARDGLCPPFPNPTHGPTCERPHRTVRSVLADLWFPSNDASLRKWKEGERRHPAFGASSRRLTADEPFPTIKASDTAQNRLVHPWFDRYLYMPELLRAQSFPDDFIAFKRTPAIGNAVPPVLAWHIARRLMKER